MVAHLGRGWFAWVLVAGGARGSGARGGFAETMDVVAWWSQPCRSVRTAERLLGSAENVVDDVDGLVCANGSLGSPRRLGADRARRRSAVATRGEMATQPLLDRVLGVVKTRRWLSMAESVQWM